MRSAQRQKRLGQKVRKNVFLLWSKILAIPLVVIFIFIALFFSTKYWSSKDKFGFTFRTDSGDVGVTVLDPAADEMTTLIIPGDTEVVVAKNYGTLRIKNVWQLSMNEKLGGSLLTGTVTQNFLFPVFLWSDSDAAKVGDADFWGILKFVFIPKSTNIPFGDRLHAGLFAITVQDLNKTQVDLGKSQFLHKEKLSDGVVGFRMTGPVSQRLAVYFSDNNIANKNVKVSIVDATGEPGLAQKVGEILEVLGGKVVSIDKKTENSNSDCTILGIDKTTLTKVSNLFGCKILKDKTDFDLEVRLGTQFAKRF